MASFLDGDVLIQSDPRLGLPYHEFNVVVVTGSGMNFCGHALLNVGGLGGFYVHILGDFKTPRILTHPQYLTYLGGHGKKELIRKSVNVPLPKRTLQAIEKSLAQNWMYGLLVHNCVTYVEQLLEEGLCRFHILSNCPVMIGAWE